MVTELQILKADGSAGDVLPIRDNWIELEKGGQAVHNCVVAFLARNRAGTAATKTRGKVRGGGAKPYRQKGTGRARAGSIRSPLWRGGGTIFGPSPRKYTKRVNRKVHALALKRTFSERLRDGDVVLVDEIEIPEPRTREVVRFLDRVNAGEDALIIVDEPTSDLLLASRNLPGVEVMKAASVNPYWMLLFGKILFTKAGLDAFVERFNAREKAS